MKTSRFTIWPLAMTFFINNTSGETEWLNGALRYGTSRFCLEKDVDMGSWTAEMGFTNVQPDGAFWTATKKSASGTGSTIAAVRVWAVNMTHNKGGVFLVNKPSAFAVWPVGVGN